MGRIWLGCVHSHPKIHKLPMKFIFLPCHSTYYDFIIILGIKETHPQSSISFRVFFSYFSLNFKSFNIKEIKK